MLQYNEIQKYPLGVTIPIVLIIYNNFARKLKNFYFTEGSRDQFGMQSNTSVARDILQAKLVKGTRCKVKFSISRKSCCTQFYRLWNTK